MGIMLGEAELPQHGLRYSVHIITKAMKAACLYVIMRRC